MSVDTSAVANFTVVAVGATAIALLDGTSKRETVTIHNAHATQVLYVGSTADVLTTDGLPILAGQHKVFEHYSGPLWGIASGAGTDTRIWEVGG